MIVKYKSNGVGQQDGRNNKRRNKKFNKWRKTNANGKEQRFKKEEEEQRIQEEVTWIEDYFMSIRQLCPWSLKYWMENKILHLKDPNGCELTWCACFKASPHEAILFEYDMNTSVDKLYEVTEKIEKKYPELIAFWSHPEEKQNNTPKPCVIVQDRSTLTDLRKQIGFEDE